MKKYKVGYVAGFFDILHGGHIDILKAAKSQCERLIVAVGTDEFMRKRKNREAVQCFSERVKIVSAIRYVDEVVEETDLDKLAAYHQYRFDVMFAGSDHKSEKLYEYYAYELKNRYGVDTIYIERDEKSSTEVRRRVCAMNDVVTDT